MGISETVGASRAEPGPVLTGLAETEADARRRRGLGNNAPIPSSRSYGEIVRENVFTFINNVLFGLGIALVAVGRVSDAVVSVGVAMLNVVVSVAQEVRAKRTLDRIALLTRPRVSVIRDGRERRVSPEAVVQGDLLVVRPGDQIVADGTVVGDGVIDADESLLSGEADRIPKRSGDQVFSGTFCVTGSARYQAERVGGESAAGQLTRGARAFRRILTPLQREIHLIIRVMLLVVVGFELLLLVDAAVNRHPLVDSVQDAVVIAGLVPIGLFLAITTSYALGALRLAGRGALVQQVNAVESLSAADIMCLDKTGTLTANALWLEALEPLGLTEDQLRGLLGDFAASVTAGNRTSEAIAAACPGRRRPVLDEASFSSLWRWSGLTWRDGADTRTYVLGAPEALRPALPPSAPVPAAIDTWAAQGLRVLLFAAAPGAPPLRDHAGEVALPPALTPLGLLALRDALRPEARETLAAFAAAGIAVKVISGDSTGTVAALARQAGLPGAGSARSGADVAGLDAAQLGRVAEETAVFGRVAPQQKAQLVQALRARGHRVAMIGDGVNDVLALKQADLGVAMRSGSAAARAVADIVLLGDSFAPLPQAFREGQRIRIGMHGILKLFLTRVVFFSLLLLAAKAIGETFPFSPKQEGVLTLFTVGIPSLALAAWAHPGRAARLGTARALVQFVFPAGVTMTLAALAVLVWTLIPYRDAYLGAHPGATAAVVTAYVEPLVQSAETTLGVLCGLLLIVFTEPPSRLFAGRSAISPDRRPAGLAAALLLAYGGVLALPPLRAFFDIAPLRPSDYALILAATVLWAVAVRWAWRHRVLERLLQFDLDDQQPA